MICPTCGRQRWRTDDDHPLRFTDHCELDVRPLPPSRPNPSKDEELGDLLPPQPRPPADPSSGKLPPSQPPGWVDVDPLHVEPEAIVPRVSYPGWDPSSKPVGHDFALVGLGICIGIVVFALIFTIGRSVDAASRSGLTTDPVDMSGTSSAAQSGAPLIDHGSGASGSLRSGDDGRRAGGAPSPRGAITFVVSASATWCAPTEDRCQAWGGNAKLAAVSSFHDGDEPYLVRVSRGERSVTALVVSYCACRGSDRAIDLSPAAFEVLAPLSRGRVDVVLEWPVAEPPRTDADLRMMLEVRGDELYQP